MRALGRSLKRILCRMMPITSNSTSGGSCSPQSAFVFFFRSTSRGFLSVTFVPASSWYPHSEGVPCLLPHGEHLQAPDQPRNQMTREGQRMKRDLLPWKMKMGRGRSRGGRCGVPGCRRRRRPAAAPRPAAPRRPTPGTTTRRTRTAPGSASPALCFPPFPFAG